MGGAVGHLMHLYDDPDLTIGKIKHVLRLASEGKLENVTEKVDGRNIVFSWDVSKNALKLALVSGEILSGGVSETQMIEKFKDRRGALEAYVNGRRILKEAIENIPDETKRIVFGDSANRWFSAEIIYPASPNVVRYDSNTIIFHESPIFEIQGGKIVTKQTGPEISTLKNSIDSEKRETKKDDWSIRGPIVISMEKLADDPAHEADRQEHGHDGQGGGQHGQSNFLGANHGGIVGLFAHLHMSDDVFSNDDGIVNQEPDTQ
jgi:hypothetical protein